MGLAALSETDLLGKAFQQFAGMSEEEFQLSVPFWHIRDYKKGEYFNRHKTVCEYLGFTVQGFFRSYIIDEKSKEEKNVFLFPPNQFVVAFKSFINQLPCDYHTQAMTDARVVRIGIIDLLELYRTSHQWEHFGRLLAQEGFNAAMERTESFLFKTPEQRYLDLAKAQPDIFNAIPLYHISSYLGIQGPSLSRIRKRLSGK